MNDGQVSLTGKCSVWLFDWQSVFGVVASQLAPA